MRNFDCGRKRTTGPRCVEERASSSSANETQRVVWTKLCDTISDLAIGTNFNWPELFPFVIKCASGNSNAHIEAALRVLAPMSLHIAENMKMIWYRFETCLRVVWDVTMQESRLLRSRRWHSSSYYSDRSRSDLVQRSHYCYYKFSRSSRQGRSM